MAGTSLLASFVPDLVLGWPQRVPPLRYRRISGSMLHADISGMTRLSETLAVRGAEGPEILTKRINAAFDPIIRAAVEEGGDILKFGGDAVLVLFSGRDHARQALQSGGRMQLALATRAGAGRVPLSMTVGIHTGDFDFWLVGGETRELLVAGPAGTTVVLTEESAKAGQVLTQSSTLRALRREGGVGGMVVFDTDQGGSSRTPPDNLATLGRDVPRRILPEVSAVETTEGSLGLVAQGFVLCQGLDALVDAGHAEDLADHLELLMATIASAEQDYGVAFIHSDIAIDGFKILLAAGAPQTTGQDADAIVQAVRRIVDCPVPLQLRGSVHSGRAYAGFLGNEQRRTYSLMGDNVNLTSHLLTAAGAGEMVASTALLSETSLQTETRPLPPIATKGKAEPTALATVVAVTKRQKTKTASVLPLIGREDERRELMEALDDAASERGAAIDLVGESGSGKTRLLQEVLAGNAERLAVAHHRCDRFRRHDTFGAIRPLLRQLLDIPIEADGGQAAVLLDQRVTRTRDAPNPLLPLMADLIGADVEATPESEAVDPEFRTGQAIEVLMETMCTLRRPALIVVEDVHFVDNASRRVLSGLARIAPHLPWLLVFTRRPEVAGAVDGVGREIRLRALNRHDLRSLVLAASTRPLPEHLVASICERSDGNPLFATQLAGAVSEVGELPPDVEAMVTAQLHALAPDLRLIVVLASVFGRVMDRSLASALISQEVPGFDPRRFEEVSDLLEVAGDKLSFALALQQEAAYASLPFATRRRLHGSIGGLLEEQRDGGLPVSSASLAFHFSEAWDRDRAWRYGCLAGDEAARHYANDEAADAYRRALVASSHHRSVPRRARFDLAIDLGDVLERAGRYEEALKVFESARRLGTEPLQRTTLAQRRAWIRFRQGDYRAAQRMRSRLLAELEPDEPQFRSIVRQVRLNQMAQMTRVSSTLDFAELSEAVVSSARFDEDLADEAQAHNYRLGHQLEPPSIEDAERLAKIADDLCRRTGDDALRASVHNNLGTSRHTNGDWDRAVEAYRLSLSGFGRVGNTVQAAIVSNNIGEILSDQGRFDEAEQRFVEAERIWSAAQFRIGLAFAAMNLGRLDLRRGDAEHAGRRLTQAESILSDLGAESFFAQAHLYTAEAAVVADRFAEAIELVVGDAGSPADDLPPDAKLVLAACAHRMGDQREAATFARSALEASTTGPAILHSLATLEYLGEASPDEIRSRRSLVGQLGVVRLPLLIAIGGQDDHRR